MGGGHDLGRWRSPGRVLAQREGQIRGVLPRRNADLPLGVREAGRAGDRESNAGSTAATAR
eukprot:4270090-Alexandrium_andersonii.AAC.1